MLRIRFIHEADGWTWEMLVDDVVTHRSADRFGSEPGAKWDARRRLAMMLQDIAKPLQQAQ